MTQRTTHPVTVAEAKSWVISQIAECYGDREITNITAILLEDGLNLPANQQESPFPSRLWPLLQDYVDRLRDGEPVQYITGVAHFYGDRYAVDKDVLIPRPETEELVFELTQRLRKSATSDRLKILDVGAGSGCIAITLKKNFPEAEVTGLDISEAAIQVARKNAIQLHQEVIFRADDILTPSHWLQACQWDIIISNPPYIIHSELDEMPDQVAKHEPPIALFAPEDDPIKIYDTIFQYAESHVTKGGWIAVELNEFQAQRIYRIANELFRDVEICKDMQGKVRMLFARN